ncbi:hypothetical protein [Jejuia spongiicola]|uniref:DUF1579 domain-containing protein n=1 Tax=Jejuia spongiicola TaxID=2942207 RepID=A0ABT0Q9F9_9FLAO|nr:hypothetical protein [Jejuia spongiicola]MCL6293602.1 hypothetical protein [Jejuia spongiicola]
MKRIVVIFLIVFMPIVTMGQSAELSIFENLIDKTWKADGNWGDGSKFIQEITFKYDLEKTIIIADSKGFIDKEQTQIGDRNMGIRKFDAASKTIKFWEFDVFGGVTEGTVLAEGKNIIYQYQYGTSVVTDMWEYVNDNTYNFKVGTYEKGVWKQVYLSTQFIRQTKE